MKIKHYRNNPTELKSQIETLLKDNTDIEFGYKLSFISMVLNGSLPKEAAEYCIYDERTIQKWVKIADEQGLESLKRKKQEGRPPVLSEIQKAEIKRVIENPDSLKTYGYQAWNGKTLSDFLSTTHHIEMSVRSCQYLLHELKKTI